MSLDHGSRYAVASTAQTTPMTLQAIATSRLYHRIADQLANHIDRGEFPPGSLLPPERELARQLGVSRSSVREALIALEVLGRVEVRVGHGVVVRDAKTPVVGNGEPWRLDDTLGIELDFDIEIPPFALLEARRLIEPETAALAAINATPEQRAGIHAAYEQNVEDNRAGSREHPGDRLFHIRIADASSNPAHALQIRYLLGHRYGPMFQRLQALYTPTDMPRRSQREHLTILRAIERRDAPAARRAMRKHLDSVIGIFSRPSEKSEKSGRK